MKCICQMCNCGKHRCPHFSVEGKPSSSRQRNVTSKEPCKISEYRGEFKKAPEPVPVVIRRPEDLIKSGGPVEFKTTHKVTYPKHPVESIKIPPMKKKEHRVEWCDGGMVEGESEYGGKYHGETAKPPSPPRYLKKKTQPITSGCGTMETSVTKIDYEPKEVVERPQIKKLQDNVVPSSSPFQAKSVHRTDYTKFDEPPRPTGRIPDNLTTKGQSGTFDTTNRSHYVKHALKPIVVKGPKDIYVPTSHPFEGSSIMREDYSVHDKPVRSQKVNRDSHLFSNSPMTGQTTNLDNYQSWGIPKPASVKKTSSYRPPSKEMDLQKTSDDYKYSGPSKLTKSLRPKTNIVCGGEFESNTSYNEKFVKHDLSPTRVVPPIDVHDGYVPSTGPFQDGTESKEHYVKHQTAPAKMVRRVNEVFDRTADFDGSTSYRKDYARKKLPICPVAKGISTNFNGYSMVEAGDGHRCLHKVDEGSFSADSIGVSPLPPIRDNNMVTVN